MESNARNNTKKGPGTSPGAFYLFSFGFLLMFSVANSGGNFRITYLLAINGAVAGAFLVFTRWGAVRHSIGSNPIVLFWAAAYSLLQLRNAISYGEVGDLRIGLAAAFLNLSVAAPVLCALSWKFKANVFLTGILVALLGYCWVNLLGHVAGIHPQLQSTVGDFYAVARDGTSQRLTAPFSPGINSFGVQAIVLLCLGIGYIFLLERTANWIWVCVIGFASVGAGIAAYLTDTRSYLFIVPMFVSAFICLRVTRRYRWLVVAIFGLIALFPIIYLGFFNSSVPSVFDAFAARYERSVGDFWLLSGRVYLWEYTIDLISSGSVPLFGIGIAVRDVSVAISSVTGSAGLALVTRHAHNGALDMILVFGPAGLCLVGALIYSIARKVDVSFLGSSARAQSLRRMGALMLIMAVVPNATESFMNDILFWVLLLATVVYFSLATSETEGFRRRAVLRLANGEKVLGSR